jgi:ComF family protein
MSEAAKKALRGFFNLLFPDECRVCGESLHEVSRIPVCSRCLREPQPLAAEYYCSACRTPFVTPHPLDPATGKCALCRQGLQGFDAVYSYGSYEGTLRKLIHVYKYDGVEPLAAPFGKLLAQVLPREEHFDVVVPMPLHWRKRWQRGFNQAELLAREIARRWNAPVNHALRRRRAGRPQAGLTNAQRRSNVAGVFAIKRNLFDEQKPLKGKRVLLIDDVFTTGATASACARVLKRAGAEHVTLLALARTDRRAPVVEIAQAASSARSSGVT